MTEHDALRSCTPTSSSSALVPGFHSQPASPAVRTIPPEWESRAGRLQQIPKVHEGGLGWGLSPQ